MPRNSSLVLPGSGWTCSADIKALKSVQFRHGEQEGDRRKGFGPCQEHDRYLLTLLLARDLCGDTVGAGRVTPAGATLVPGVFPTSTTLSFFKLDFEDFLSSRCVTDTLYCNLYKSVPSFL